MAEQKPKILVVDDEEAMAEMVADALAERGYDARHSSSGIEAVALVTNESFDAVVTDLRMAGADGMQVLAASRKAAPERPVILMTAYSAIETAVEAIRQGAHHYLTKPFKVDELALFLARALDEAKLRRETKTLKRALHDHYPLETLVGRSGAIAELSDLVLRVADAAAPVLITGETGSGKGRVARAIHAEGSRASGPFVTVNCAALPENLLESELFGHVKGAFTGATQARVGLIEEAEHGTIFLDEIGEMPLTLQTKLLHVLESGRVRALGANKEREIDTRFVAATHRDLRKEVAAGKFREDLLYRLEVVTLDVPPLRQRKTDIPILIEHFLKVSRARNPNTHVQGFGEDALDRLMKHDWPGNVRELEHVIERVVVLSRNAKVTAAELPASVTVAATKEPAFEGAVVTMREMQRRYAAWAFGELGAHKAHTAETLDVDVKTLTKLLQEK
ncbi:MAG TPA: sigma-54 dependent transcriptional regulator [Polyangiaceae bacterium]